MKTEQTDRDHRAAQNATFYLTKQQGRYRSKGALERSTEGRRKSKYKVYPGETAEREKPFRNARPSGRKQQPLADRKSGGGIMGTLGGTVPPDAEREQKPRDHT